MECTEVDKCFSSKAKAGENFLKSKLPLTILVVEDEPLINDFLVKVLESVGFDVLVASSGEEGIKIASASTQKISLVILDVGLPGMHVARAMAKFREINDMVKILISSGFPLRDLSRELPIREMDGFIAKPFDPKLLIAEIEKLIER